MTHYPETDKTMPERHDYDFYVTPVELARAALQTIELPENRIFYAMDPGAGTGIWGKALKSIRPEAIVTGIEVQEDLKSTEDYRFWHNCDFLEYESVPTYDLVMGNPPYKHAEEFVRRGLGMTKTGGFVVYLLRLDFLASLKRGKGLFGEFPPQAVTISSRRPSFYEGSKKTHYNDYCIITWKVGYVNGTKLDWLVWDYSE